MLDVTSYHCRIVSNQFRAETWNDFQIDNVHYSARLSLEKADALLALYDPTDELISFKGPKLWYTMEPSWHHHYHSHPIGKKLVRNLAPEERAYFSHPIVDYRIPHPTFRSPLTSPRSEKTKNSAVSCVSNFGGRTWYFKRGFRFRNSFLLDPRVELYGKRESWDKFPNFPFFWNRKPPKNYQGPVKFGRDHFDEAFILFLSEFKVAICLENAIEDMYFTEKFVNAVRAGCIPVYRAHDSVRNCFLKGAKWIDPADFGNSAKLTISYALNENIDAYRSVNDQWLQNDVLRETDDKLIIGRLHKIIQSKLHPMHSGPTSSQ